MNELLTLKRNAKMLGLCGVYADRWDEAQDKEELVRLATDANGVEFLCDGVAFGWGLTAEFIKANFAKYINGYTINNPKGYTSQLYVNETSPIITVEATITAFIGCNCGIVVPQYSIAKIYVAGKSKIDLHNNGECYVYCYGDDSKIDFHGDNDKIHFEHIKQSKWKKQ